MQNPGHAHSHAPSHAPACVVYPDRFNCLRSAPNASESKTAHLGRRSVFTCGLRNDTLSFCAVMVTSWWHMKRRSLYAFIMQNYRIWAFLCLTLSRH